MKAIALLLLLCSVITFAGDSNIFVFHMGWYHPAKAVPIAIAMDYTREGYSLILSNHESKKVLVYFIVVISLLATMHYSYKKIKKDNRIYKENK